MAELYYLCSENKGADQLRSYRVADLRLCFHVKTGILATLLILNQPGTLFCKPYTSKLYIDSVLLFVRLLGLKLIFSIEIFRFIIVKASKTASYNKQ